MIHEYEYDIIDIWIYGYTYILRNSLVFISFFSDFSQHRNAIINTCCALSRSDCIRKRLVFNISARER